MKRHGAFRISSNIELSLGRKTLSLVLLWWPPILPVCGVDSAPLKAVSTGGLTSYSCPQRVMEWMDAASDRWRKICTLYLVKKI